MLFALGSAILTQPGRCCAVMYVQRGVCRCVAVALLAALAQPALAGDQTTYALKPSLRAGQLQLAKVMVEVGGELKLNPDGKQVTRLPLKVTGSLEYEERIQPTADPSQQQLAVRYYREANADIVAGKAQRRAELSQERRIVAVEAHQTGTILFSPLGPLQRDELELIDVPGNSLLVSRLLPENEVRVGDDWTHSNEVLAALLDVDAISQSDVRSTLREVKDNVALIELEGKATGAAGGVATEVELKAKYNYDLTRGIVTWLAMAIKEDRSIGHAEPGFEVNARVRMALTPLDRSEQLAETVVAELDLQPTEGGQLLAFAAERAGYRLLHDRRWQVMHDRHDVTIMRMVDRGDLVAQCNISRLPDNAEGQHIQLEEFQRDIQRTLGESFRQFVEATQSETEDGIRILRVVAEGKTSEIPVRWLYYHLADAKGQRLGLVFTLESGLVERFAGTDQTFVSSMQFTDRAEPTPAEASTADRSSDAQQR